jgi:hypothetical protein
MALNWKTRGWGSKEFLEARASRAVGGRYEIRSGDKGDYKAIHLTYWRYRDGYGGGGDDWDRRPVGSDFRTLEAAKVAAEQDNDQRRSEAKKIFRADQGGAAA